MSKQLRPGMLIGVKDRVRWSFLRGEDLGRPSFTGTCLVLDVNLTGPWCWLHVLPVGRSNAFWCVVLSDREVLEPW